MTVLKYVLLFFLLTLAPKRIWSAGQFECGEHGRFEYCIDEIPGCVVGCHCHPGFYFDANSKMCEPNSQLLVQRRMSNTERKVKGNSENAMRAEVITDVDKIGKDVEKIEKDADDLEDWLYNKFFSAIEKQAENQTKTLTTRRSDSQKLSYNRKPNNRGRTKKEKTRNLDENNSVFEATSSEAEISMRTSRESDEEFDKTKEDTNENSASEHDHRHIMMINRKKRIRPPPNKSSHSGSQSLPSFIFLPNMETPFYPPLGLPPPPVVPMYPIVPVPPVVPMLPVAVPQIAAIQPNVLNTKVFCSQCPEKTLAETTSKPTVKTTLEPTTEFTLKSTTETTSKPTTETTTEYTTKTSLKTTVTTTLEPTTETTTESTTTITLRTTIETTMKPTTKVTSESVSETTTKPTPETTTETTTHATTVTELKTEAQTTLEPTEADVKSTATETTLKPTSLISITSTKETNSKTDNETTSESNTDTDLILTTETKLNTITETESTTPIVKTEINSTNEAALKSTTETELNTTIETETLTDTSLMTTDSTINDSKIQDALRRAHDLIDYYEFLEDLDNPKLFDRRKELKNSRMKKIQLNDHILRNKDFRTNPVKHARNSFKEESSKSHKDLNVPLRATNLLNTILNKAVNDKKSQITNKVDFKYISDLIHKVKFNDTFNEEDYDSHHAIYPENFKNYDMQHQFDKKNHDEGYDSSVKNPENVYYSNLGRQIASLIRNTETGEEREKKYDNRLIHLKENSPTYFSERNVRSPFNSLNSNNADHLRRGNELLLNLENKVMGTTPGALGLEPIDNMNNRMRETRYDVAEKVQKSNIAPDVEETVHNNKNVYWVQENKNNILNIQPLEHNIDKVKDRGADVSKIPFWHGSNDKSNDLGKPFASYKPILNNEVQNSNAPNPLQKQFPHHQQVNPKAANDAPLFKHNTFVNQDFFMKTTRRPGRSYIGRTFFSGDIM